MSEIKFDNVENLRNIVNSKNNQPAKEQKPGVSPEKEGIAIHLSSLSDLTVADTSAADNARVLEMKNRIQTNNYHINTDALAKKLLPHLFKTIG